MTEPGFGTNVEDALLSDWRRRATDIVLLASAVLNLPGVILLLSGQGPAVGWAAEAAVFTAYLVTVAAAVLRRIDCTLRVRALLGALYLGAIVGALAVPQGPFVRSLPIVAPILAIGLMGVRPARIATAISASILILAPLLHRLPAVTRALGVPSTPAADEPGLMLAVGLGLTAEMVALMILLESLYGFLLKTLAAERGATAERMAASRKLEIEAEERLRLERELARVGDDERCRMGQEIHDGLCQQLAGALLRFQALELHLERGAPLSAAELAPLSSLLSETIHEARAVAEGLCPLEPTPGALAPALRGLAKRTQHVSGVPCVFHASGDVLVPDPNTAQHLYRITQEALSNAVRHASAGRIAVGLHGGDDGLLLRVEDNGVGLPGTVPPGGMGLRTMAFRAKVIEGEFAVEPAPGGGTRVSCRVPRSPVVLPGAPGHAIHDGRAT